MRKKLAPKQRRALFSDRRSLMILMLVLGGVAAATIRPDFDDSCYVSLPVYYMDHPGEAFSLVNHSFALLKQPFIKTLDSLYFIQAIDYYWACLAAVFSCGLIDIYYLTVPLFMGAMIPLAWFWVLSKFSDRTASCVIGAVVICAFLLLNGQEHRAFGNFSFVRIWQCKSILMSIGFPVFTGMSITFFEAPNKKNWLILVAMGMSAVGLSKSGLFLYPILLLMLGTANTVSDWYHGRKSIKKLAAYLASGIYPGLIGLFFKFWVIDENFFYNINLSWPQSFWGQFSYVFGGVGSVISICLFTFLILQIVCVGKGRSVMLITWNLAMLVLINPLTYPFVMKNVTTANAYWRLFYLLPFPLSIGIVIAHFSDKYKLRPAGTMLAAGLVVALVSLIPKTKTTLNQVSYGLFQHKVRPDIDAGIMEIIDFMPAGDTIAPRIFSGWIQVYSSEYPLVFIRPEYLEAVSIHIGDPEFYKTRFNAVRLVEGRFSPENLNALKTLIDEGLDNIILRKSMYRHPDVRAMIDQYGFRMTGESGDFAVLSRRLSTASGGRT